MYVEKGLHTFTVCGGSPVHGERAVWEHAKTCMNIDTELTFVHYCKSEAKASQAQNTWD